MTAIALTLIDSEDNRNVNKTEIKSLAANIKQVGMLNPISLKKTGERYKVVAGRRRFKALQLLERVEIAEKDYRIVPEDADENFVAFCENFHRENLSLAEEVEQLAQLKDKYSIPEISVMLGKSASWVALRIQLTNLSAYWSECLKNPDENPSMNVTKLQEIAKYPIEVQERVTGYFNNSSSAKEIKERLKHMMERPLESATFDTSACEKCAKRSNCQPLLFGNPKKDSCLDSACFNQKLVEHISSEIEKIKANKSEIYIIRSEYPGYDSPLVKFYYEALGSELYKISECKGESNAFMVTGKDAGRYMTITIKKKDEKNAQRYSGVFLAVQDAEKASEPEKKEKTLEDREADLKMKRTKVALEYFTEFIEDEKRYEDLKSRNEKFSIVILALTMSLGVSSNFYSHEIEADVTKFYIQLEENSECFYKACWDSLKKTISNRVGQELYKVLADISDDDAKTFCKILKIDYDKEIFAIAEEKVKPSKVLLMERLKAVEKKTA